MKELSSHYTGDGIKELIPQRPPIMMVDEFSSDDENNADTGLHVNADNFFCYNDKLQEPGLIEHIAQSASALAGFNAIKRGEVSGLGYIGEVKKCTIYMLPSVGSALRTHIQILSETLGISLLKAETEADGTAVCSCMMKISMKQ